MAMCPDFLNEDGMMEHIGANLGVEVMLTPKCHAKIAGEGVEYMWACSEGAYRNLALKDNTSERCGFYTHAPTIQFWTIS